MASGGQMIHTARGNSDDNVLSESSGATDYDSTRRGQTTSSTFRKRPPKLSIWKVQQFSRKLSKSKLTIWNGMKQLVNVMTFTIGIACMWTPFVTEDSRAPSRNNGSRLWLRLAATLVMPCQSPPTTPFPFVEFCQHMKTGFQLPRPLIGKA